MFVASAKYVMAFTFCFIGEIPFPDTKCPKYLILFLKKSHSDIFNLIPASQNVSKTNFYMFQVYVFSFGCIKKVMHPKYQKVIQIFKE